MQLPLLRLVFETTLPVCSHDFDSSHLSVTLTPRRDPKYLGTWLTPRATMAMPITSMPSLDQKLTDFDQQVEERLYSYSGPN